MSKQRAISIQILHCLLNICSPSFSLPSVYPPLSFSLNHAFWLHTCPFTMWVPRLLPGTPPREGNSLGIWSIWPSISSQVEWEVKEEEGEGKRKEEDERRRKSRRRKRRGGRGLFHYPYLCVLLAQLLFFLSLLKSLFYWQKIPHLLGRRRKICPCAAFSLILHKPEPFRLLWGFLWWAIGMQSGKHSHREAGEDIKPVHLTANQLPDS